MRQPVNIPAGYQIQVESWENDGDNYNTKVISGLTEDECSFYAAVCDYFGQRGNDFLFVPNILKDLQVIFDKYKFGFDEGMAREWHSVLADDYDLSELTNDILGYPSECYYSMGDDKKEFFRTVESYRVYYIEREMPDLSREFAE
jgi:hypothetical protein